jgi:hypothetical protein
MPGSVEVYGIDIEVRLFPAAGSPPHNVHLRLNSVTNLPSEWSGTFAFVNQRFLVAALQEHEWPIALKELHRVLATEGWLQLCEPDSNWSGGLIVDRHKELTTALYESRGFSISIANELFANSGFMDIHVERRVIPLGNGRENMVRTGGHLEGHENAGNDGGWFGHCPFVTWPQVRFSGSPIPR